MLVKYLAVVMVVWLSVAFLGGLRDGKIFAQGAEDTQNVNALSQVQILSNPFSGTGYNVIRWIGAGISWLVNLLAVLSLQSSIFNGSWGNFLRALILGMIFVPVIIELIARALGRTSG